MFHKENSSLWGSSSSSKTTKKQTKAMDVAVRKSDRRSLAQVAFAKVLPQRAREEKEEGPSLELEHCCNVVFLEGSLACRTLKHAQLGKVQLYFRSPSSSSEPTSDDNKNDETSATTTTTWQWPYRSTTQCVWMTVLMEKEEGKIHAPTVALLAALLRQQSDTENDVADIALPCVTVPSSVSKFLCRGAHLMRAGMLTAPSHVEQQQQQQQTIVAVVAASNPQPFAVGRLIPASDNRGKGIGVEIWTCYGDDLWRQQLRTKPARHERDGQVVNPVGGAPFDNGHYGNVGFLDGKYVHPIVQVGPTETQDATAQEQIEASHTDDEPVVKPQLTEMAAVSVQGEKETRGNIIPDPQDVSHAVSSDEEMPQTDDSRSETNPNDVLLHKAVCKALVQISNSQLPMTTSNFYAQHVLPNRPPDTTIQLKQTTWKKFGPYLAEQAQRGLVDVQPQGDNPVGFLSAIHRKHEDLRGIRKEESAAAKHSTTKKLAIVNLFVIPHHFINLLRLDPDQVAATNAKSEERRGTGMLTTPEARAVLEEYLQRNELLQSNAQVQLDGPLTDALYKKHPGTPPTVLSRKEIVERWMEKLDSAYALVEMPGSHILKMGRGPSPTVTMEVSMRQARKYVTRVRGLEEFGIDPSEFTKDVMRRFACSGGVETDSMSGRPALKKGHVEIVFQGHLVEELRALLVGDERLTSHGGAKGSEYCLPKAVIQVVLRKGVPAKKKK